MEFVYQPTPTRLFNEMLGALDVSPRDFTLVDFWMRKGQDTAAGGSFWIQEGDRGRILERPRSNCP